MQQHCHRRTRCKGGVTMEPPWVVLWRWRRGSDEGGETDQVDTFCTLCFLRSLLLSHSLSPTHALTPLTLLLLAHTHTLLLPLLLVPPPRSDQIEQQQTNSPLLSSCYKEEVECPRGGGEERQGKGHTHTVQTVLTHTLSLLA